MRLRFFTKTPSFDIVGKRHIAYLFSGGLVLLTIVLLLTKGLNLGIDFKGGLLIEVKVPETLTIGAVRDKVNQLNLGETSLQEFGDPQTLLIRVQHTDGQNPQGTIEKIKQTLGNGVDYRRVEFVGPQVGDELKKAGIIGIALALLGIMVYVWFRFEWPFAIWSVVALLHDVFLTVGFFALLGLDFNLTAIAALLTIAGYSINDTVVIYDRIRENLRKYKQLPLPEMINRSLNETFSRTIMTSMTTALAVLALLIFGGEVIRNFSAAMLFGIVIGSYSTIFLASPLLLNHDLRKIIGLKPSSPTKSSAANPMV